MKQNYLNFIYKIERLQNLFSKVIKNTLDRMDIHDITPVQCLLLYNIGKCGEKLIISELEKRRYYLGTNVSYNVNKMIKNGYLTKTRYDHDGRAYSIWLSEKKGLKLLEKLEESFKLQAEALKSKFMEENQLEKTLKTLYRIESFWDKTIILDEA